MTHCRGTQLPLSQAELTRAPAGTDRRPSLELCLMAHHQHPCSARNSPLLPILLTACSRDHLPVPILISPLSTAVFFKAALTIFPDPGSSLGSAICAFSAKPTQIQGPLGSSLLPDRSCCCIALRGAWLPAPHPALQSCVSPLPTLGSSPPGLSTSKLPSFKPGSFQTSWLCYIHLFTGTCQSLLFSSIPFPSWRGKGHPATGSQL